MPYYFMMFGREIPIYGICFFAGIFAAAAVGVLLVGRQTDLPRYDVVYSAVYVMIGAMIGSKLLFLLVSYREIIELQLPLSAVIKGGFVFYGGLIGGAVGLLIYCRQFHMILAPFLDIYAAVLPLGHSIGRIGCFFGGCCYGIPYRGWGNVVYRETVGNTPLHTPLLPIQLIESGCLFLLFTVLLVVFIRKPFSGLCLKIYIFAYPLLRICLECFRGDRERGILLGLSTSQWVSIGILVSAAGILLWRRSNGRKKIKEKWVLGGKQK